MNDVIDRFCAEYHEYNGITHDRRVMQARVLRQLEATIGGDLLTCEAPDLRTFLAGELAAGLAPSTVQRDLKALRPFFRWAWQSKLIDAERLMELRDVPPPRVAQALPRPYKREQIQKLWLDVDARWPRLDEKGLRFIGRYQRGTSRWGRVQSHAKHLQLEAIITLALYGALRRDEILRLGYDDMHPDNSVIVVTGARKNLDGSSHQRPVPMFSPIRTAIEDWYEVRELIGPDHDSPWLSCHYQHRAKPLQERTFRSLLTRTGRGWEFHRLRHTAATEMLRAGMPLEKVSKVLGHKRVEQTLLYTELLPGDLVAAADKAEAKFVQAVGRLKKAA